MHYIANNYNNQIKSWEDNEEEYRIFTNYLLTLVCKMNIMIIKELKSESQ